MRMMNSYFHAPVAPWVRNLACWFHVAKTIILYKLYCILNAFKTVDLILRRGVFVNLDCNLQTVEAKPATAIVVGDSAK